MEKNKLGRREEIGNVLSWGMSIKPSLLGHSIQINFSPLFSFKYPCCSVTKSFFFNFILFLNFT